MAIHVIPLNDLKPHEESSTCPCCPELIMENGEMIFAHNSWDGREEKEVKRERFKVHMLAYADENTFRTMCGIISWNRSDQFCDDAELVEFGDTKNTTCKKCLAALKKAMRIYDEQTEQ